LQELVDRVLVWEGELEEVVNGISELKTTVETKRAGRRAQCGSFFQGEQRVGGRAELEKEGSTVDRGGDAAYTVDHDNENVFEHAFLRLNWGECGVNEMEDSACRSAHILKFEQASVKATVSPRDVLSVVSSVVVKNGTRTGGVKASELEPKLAGSLLSHGAG
jgi:hypothetical protein